ncbi:hypothetical protein [Asticcacaulis sp. AC402]|nr:hypothetical protein [Asticcacaulis sp. AC402]ESQ75042.1 hypothetical protein ABAC402_11600 [Asticcacaulis sp. AC402]
MSEGAGKSWTTVGIILHPGDQPLSFGDRMSALPLSVFWAKGWQQA